MHGGVAGRSVLLTGAGGSLGSALAKAIIQLEPRQLILLDHSERNLHEIDSELTGVLSSIPFTSVLGDICDAGLLSEIFDRYRPEIVYHAAAFKHVPLMESNPLAAVRNNALGTNTLAKISRIAGVRTFVMASTDKAVNPISVMGASKRVAELALLRWGGSTNRMRALRLGNILASVGSVVPTFLRQISRGGPVTVTHPEVCRYFHTMSEAVELALLTSRIEIGGGIFIPRLGAPVRILDMARQLVSDSQSQSKSGNEISVTFTGLRPGDKMSEEFLFANESVEPTPNRTLLRVSTAEVPSEKFDAHIESLSRSVEQRDLPLMLELLCQMLPDYRPTEALDRSRQGSSVLLK
ncbi:MAG TPA: polysaccharide biosynthesis protein [Candidatus Acidoferrum sp.]|nr:polysaccharide biosynthesis protein [Candidatus Acidoferrum sp.]